MYPSRLLMKHLKVTRRSESYDNYLKQDQVRYTGKLIKQQFKYNFTFTYFIEVIITSANVHMHIFKYDSFANCIMILFTTNCNLYSTFIFYCIEQRLRTLF